MSASTVQPDLFGEYDAEQERAALWQQPATCPACGRNEPNGLLLSQNHGIEPGQTHNPYNGHGWCMARYLKTNHIMHAVRTGDDDRLRLEVTRGRELGLDVDAIVEAAREPQS